MTHVLRRLRARSLTILAFAAAMMLGFSTLSARAAGSSTLGPGTTITVDITLGVPNMARISSLNDVNLGAWAGANMTAFEQFCVFSTTRSYRVTATSAHGVGNRFNLDNAGTTLRYLVRWYDSNNFQRNLRNNQQSPVFDSDATSVSCAGGTNTRLRIRVRNNWAAAATAGTYTDTLTLVIQPQ